jgi:hypothetical protein
VTHVVTAPPGEVNLITTSSYFDATVSRNETIVQNSSAASIPEGLDSWPTVRLRQHTENNSRIQMGQLHVQHVHHAQQVQYVQHVQHV